jgi:SagB-type dehydrogenase family enzyme
MERRGIRYLLNWLLLVSAVAVILTGLLVDRLDLNDFTPHRWAGYAVAVLITVHVGVRWRAFLPSGASDRRGRVQVSATAVGTAPGSGEPTAREPSDDEAVDADGVEDGPGAPVGGPTAVPVGATTHPTRRTAIAAAGAAALGAAAGWTAGSAASADPYPGGDVGLFYHRQSSLGLRGLIGGVVDWGRRPAPYLNVGDGPTIALPALGPAPGMSVGQALEQRRTLRDYADRALTTEELAWVIHGATGITSAQGLRTAPSAGALYPLETYVAVSRVEGIEPGLYHVDVRGRALEPVRTGSVAGDLMVAGLGQDFLRTAPVVLVLTGLFQRTRWKYRERHYRYVCWEGGHMTQNVYLAAEAAGLGACMVGAFLDDRVNDLLGVDGRTEAALGLIALGPR